MIRLHWPTELRPAFDALFDIDDALGAVVVSAKEPVLAAVKLAWWRESLESLDFAPPIAAPSLQAAARDLLPRGVSGADLAKLEESWALLLQADNQQAFLRGGASRGPALFALAARLLDLKMDELLENSAREFGAADLGRRRIVDLVPRALPRAHSNSPRRARALTALSALARRDLRRGGPPFEQEATPGRAWTLIWHRFTGR